MEGLGRALNINIRACTADYRTPAGLDRRLKEEVRKRGKENVKKGYILFDKDDMSMESFKTNAEKYNAAVSAPCYEYWLLLHFLKQTEALPTRKNAAIF